MHGQATGSPPPTATLWKRLAGATLVYALVLAAVGWQVMSTLSDELERHGDQTNRQFTRMFTNDHWERLKPLLRLGANAEEARTNPGLDEITSLVRRFAAGTELVAVKIFNAQGLVVYATDRSLVGADRSRSEGFLASLAGAVVTERIHRDKVSGFDGETHNRDLVASYVPVRTNANVEAVIEIYSDRTAALESARRVGLRLMAVITLLSAFPLVAFLKVALALRRGWAGSWIRGKALAEALAVREGEERRAALEAARLIEIAANHLEAAAERTPEAVTERARELRQLALLESGSVRTREVAFEIGDLVTLVADGPLAEAASRDVKTLLHIAPSAQGRYLGDPELVGQALAGMIGLAVRQTPAGGSIQLRVQAEADGLAIDVLDSGVSLSLRQSALLRGEPAAAGSGADAYAVASQADEIGLRIVAGLVRTLGGRIVVRSNAERGNSTHLWLPLQPSRADAPLSSAPDGVVANGSAQ